MTASDVDKYNIPDVIEIIIFNTSSRVLSRFIPENLDIWNNGLFSATKTESVGIASRDIIVNIL